MNKRVISILAGICVSGGCLWWVLSKQDLAETGRRIVQFGLAGLAIFAALHGTAQLLRALRLWLLAGPESRLTYSLALRAVFVSYAANNILPLRIGEVVKATALARASNLRLTEALGLVAVERTMDGLILATILLVSLAGMGETAGIVGVRGMAEAMGWIFGGAVIGLIVVVGMRRRILGIMERILPAPWMLAGRRLVALLVRLSDPALLAKFVLVSAGAWLLEAWVFRIALEWVGINVGWSGAFLCLGVAAVGIALPSAPGNVGVFEAAVIVAVLGLGGDEQTGLAIGIAVHAAHWLLDTAIGLVLLPGLGWSILGGGKGMANGDGEGRGAGDEASAGTGETSTAESDQGQRNQPSASSDS